MARTTTRTVSTPVDDEPRTQSVEHEVGSTRRMLVVLVKKNWLGVAATLVVQTVVTLPAWLPWAQQVGSALHLNVAV